MIEESCELWDKYITHKSPELKEQLIVKYIVLVQKIANKISAYLPLHIQKDDLYSYGIFGLIEAVDRYDPELGIPFPAYATRRIKGAVIDGIRKEDWIPVSVRKKAKLIEEAYHKVEAKTGRNATDFEIAAELDIPTTELSKWLNSISFITMISLEEPLDNNEGNQIKDLIPDHCSPNPAKISEDNDTKRLLAKAVKELPEKEKLVISFFYYHDLANKEIAHVMELSESRISQLHAKAIFRLRGKLAKVKKNL